MNEDCRCGHPARDHNVPGFAPQCTAAGCTCLRYRAPATPTPPVAKTTEPATAARDVQVPVTVEHLLNSAAFTKSPRLVNKATKIQTLVDQLRVDLDAHLLQDEARKEIEELETRLAAARKRAGDAKPAPRPKRIPGGDHACPECDDKFTTNHGLAVHRTHKHGYRKAAAR